MDVAGRRGALFGISAVVMMVMATAFWAVAREVGSQSSGGDELPEPEQTTPPSLPDASAVVDDIETLADFGYRKIDTVAHANAGDFVELRMIDMGYEVEVQEFTTAECGYCRN